jgi:predicted amidophosphoribosyltransferase
VAERRARDGRATLGPPAGFPRCDGCPYRSVDRPDVCLGCVARRTPTPAGRQACPVCEQALGPAGRCANDWCNRGDRWFSMVWAVAHHTAAMRRTIATYKYRNQRGWAEVFARLIVGYLDQHMPWFDDYDVLTGVPVYTGAGARRPWDHVGLIVDEADRMCGPRWPFERGLITKEAETTPMAGLGLHRRHACAEGELRRALAVPDRSRVEGLRILVVDDVFTEGSTLREVARALMLSGAVEVAGLALARQPWGTRAARGPSPRPANAGPAPA